MVSKNKFLDSVANSEILMFYICRFGVICSLVAELDPMGTALHVHDSDTDIKIYLKAKLSGKIFTKGHGIRLFAQKMNLNVEEGNILVCADSESDLPMLKEVSSQSTLLNCNSYFVLTSAQLLCNW